ncbi:KAP family P-loop NTPase fold protein [Arcobacter sp.]|uniref:KAP family P-loop NTPase fold protein n=1 Tax=unclassified Arcobacter TaxID=2593671 RepID=UPI003B008512
MHKNIWDNDKLNRKSESEYLIKYLTNVYKANKESSFVLNINSEWGFGKTYFLKNLKLELENADHKVMYFDAWQNDYTKEPLLAFIAEINESFKSFFTAKQTKSKKFLTDLFKSSLPILVAALSKKLTGYSLEDLKEQLELDENEGSENSADEIDDDKDSIKTSISTLMSKATEIALEEHMTAKKSILEFKENMRKLISYIDSLSNIELPIYILIDELDRCRPNYAIELLESIKHLFDIQGLVFIIATDSKQLSHSINAVYGSKFKSEQYLKRFFDREYTLDEPYVYDYILFLLEKYNMLKDDNFYVALDEYAYNDVNKNAKIIELYAKFFKLSLRDIEQCIIVLNAIIFTWDIENKIHLGYMIFLIMLKQKNSTIFESYIIYNKKSSLGNKFSEWFKEDELNRKIKIKIDNGNTESTLEALLGEYSSFEFLTDSEHSQTRGKENNFNYRNIRKGLPKYINSYDDNEIAFKEFKDYYKYVLRGFRIN